MQTHSDRGDVCSDTTTVDAVLDLVFPARSQSNPESLGSFLSPPLSTQDTIHRRLTCYFLLQIQEVMSGMGEGVKN